MQPSTAADTKLDFEHSIGALAAAATFTQTSRTPSFDIPRTAGTFYYGACVVGVGDSDASNNCSTGVQVVVVERDFDLSVTAFSASDTSVVVGDYITFTATVRNDASALHSSPAHASALDYYRSSDSTITTTDSYLGFRSSVTELAAGATETITRTLTARDRDAGTYYYGACAEITGDSDTTNNCSAGVRVDVVRDFDLSVTAFSVAPSSVVAGNPITFSATVTNDSSATVSSPYTSVLRYFNRCNVDSRHRSWHGGCDIRIGGGGDFQRNLP